MRGAIASKRLKWLARKSGVCIGLIALLALGRHVTAQTTWYVDDDTCPAVGDGSFGNPFCSIQDGIIAAINGDSVEVAPGDYFESIDFLGKDITVYSASGDPTDTRIDALGAPHVVVFDSGESTLSILDGFSITGGNANGAFPNESGGGIYCYNFSHPTIRNCFIYGNSAANNGGGVYSSLASGFDLVQCVVTGNTASTGGAIERFGGASDAYIINCTIVGNTSTSGGVIRQAGSGSFLRVRNSVIWDNAPSGLETGSWTNAQYTNGQIVHSGTGNISADPRFEDADGADDTYGTADDDTRIKRHSPCIDAGDNDVVPPAVDLDINLDPRFHDDAGVADTGDGGVMGPPVVDMGAYEWQQDSLPVITLDPGESIQDAIDDFVEGLDTEIVLNPGTYTQSIDFAGKAITLRSTDPTNPAIVAATILDGGGTQRVILCDSGEGSDTILDGVTVQNGAVTSVNGGGMFIRQATPIIQNCVFRNNVAIADGGSADGGAISVRANYPSLKVVTIRNCSFINNHADHNGGALFFYQGGTGLIEGCVFDSNTADISGGAFAVYAKDFVCRDSVFINNTANGRGGGAVAINSAADNALFERCTYEANETTNASTTEGRGGALSIDDHYDLDFGGVIVYGGDPDNWVIRACTFVANVAENDGGGLVVNDSFGENGTVANCIFKSNQARMGGGLACEEDILVVNSLFESNSADLDGGAIFVDASFVSSVASVVNCTLLNNNSVTGVCGGISIESTAAEDTFTIDNSILWHNMGSSGLMDSDNQILESTPGLTTVRNSIVSGGWTGLGSGNLDLNPIFLDEVSGDYRLNPFSPAVDGGDSSLLPADLADLDDDADTAEVLPLDIDGNPRDLFGNVDIGAHEMALLSLPAIVNLNTAAYYQTFADAINAASDNHALLAAASTFQVQPDIDFRNTALSLTSTGDIVQPANGLYILADDSTLSATNMFNMTLNGELRIENNDTADVIAQQFITSASGELTLRSDGQLFITTAGGVALAGDATLLSGATLSFTGDLSNAGDITMFSGAILNAEDNFFNTNELFALSGSTIAVDAALDNAGTMLLAEVDLLADSLINQAAGVITVSGDLYTPINNAGQLTCIDDTLIVGDYTNGGVTTVQIGTLTIIGSLINNGTIVGDVQSSRGDLPGTQPGDGLSIVGNYIAGINSSLQMPDPVWKLTIGGNYDVAINDNNRYFMNEAELQLDGSAVQELERMSIDVGDDPAGLDRTLTGHFPIGTLRIGPVATTVDIVDNYDNDGLGQTECEAVYVDNLIVEPNALLNTNGCFIYYNSLTLLGGVDNPSNLIPIDHAPDCPADLFGNDQVVDVFDLFVLLSNWGTADSGAELAAPEDVVDVFDLFVLLGAWGSCS